MLLSCYVPASTLGPSTGLYIVAAAVLAFNVKTDARTLFTHMKNKVCAGTTSMNTSLMNGIRTNVPRSSPHGPTAVTSGIKSGMNSMTKVNTSLCRSCYNSVLTATTLNTTTFVNSSSAIVRFGTIVTPVLVTTINVILSVVNVFTIHAGRGTKVGRLLKSLTAKAGLDSMLVIITAFLVL